MGEAEYTFADIVASAEFIIAVGLIVVGFLAYKLWKSSPGDGPAEDKSDDQAGA